MNRGHRLHIDRGHRLQIIMDICPGKTFTYGTKTTIYQFADEQSIYDVGALPHIWNFAQDWSQMARPLCGRWHGRTG
jgi:hypothetical protein